MARDREYQVVAYTTWVKGMTWNVMRFSGLFLSGYLPPCSSDASALQGKASKMCRQSQESARLTKKLADDGSDVW